MGRNVEKAIINPKMRQFFGLWWEECDPELQSQLEVLIFESSTRRRRFRELVQRTPARKTNKASSLWFPGRPEIPVSDEFLHTMQETCKKERIESLVSVTFLPPADPNDRPSTANIEVLLLTHDAMAFVSFQSWLRQFARFGDYSTVEAEDEDVEDSASDVDAPPPVEEHKAPENLEKLDYSRSPAMPWEIKSIQGVWFMADSQPKARLQFNKQEDVVFFSDNEKQRWRQHIAAVIAIVDAKNENLANKKWSVKPTTKGILRAVQQEMKQSSTQRPGASRS